MVVSSPISFDAPPIKEVALGRTFLPRSDFLLPYFGSFWALIRDEFPTTEHAAPIIDNPEGFSDAFLLPRVWFLSKDTATLVQLQQNRFHYNWRQTETKKTYVRFPAVQSKCLEVWEKFEKFVSDMTSEPVKPLSGELTYTNIIDVPGANNAFEVAEQALEMSFAGAKRPFLGAPKAFGYNYTYELDGIGTLLISAVAARQKGLSNEVVKLELTVKGTCSEDDKFDDWSTKAHDTIVRAFKDLTKPAMHTHWQLRET